MELFTIQLTERLGIHQPLLGGYISGDITNQSDLNTILNDKVGFSEYNTTKTQSNTNANNIVTLFGTTSQLTSDLNTLNNQINGTNGIAANVAALITSNATKISSPTIKAIRQINLALEYTVDGETWLPVSSAGTVEWRRYHRRYYKPI